MNSNSTSNKKITVCNGTLIVGYSNSKSRPRSVSIKAELKNTTSTFAIFQFYAEFKPSLEKKWILDLNPNDIKAPYYSLLDQDSHWGYKWSDNPIYDLCSSGTIYFNTFLAEVNKLSKTDPREWNYKILCGFSWGVVSRDGNNIKPIAIKSIPQQRLGLFTCFLGCHYRKASFALDYDSRCIFENTNCNLW